MNMFFTTLMQLVWPLMAVFALIVSTLALKKHPGNGTNFMVIGSAITLLTSIANTALTVGMQNALLNLENITAAYLATGVFSLIGQVLFLLGLLLFINVARTADDQAIGL